MKSIKEAHVLSRTRFFWLVTYLADYSGWDWLWEPAPWEAHQRHAWPSKHQIDAGVYLVPTQGYDDTHYHTEHTIARLHSIDNWTVPSNIDTNSVDYSWHPNPLDPPYIYHFPSQHQSSSGATYNTPGATEVKLVDAFVVTSLPQIDGVWEVPSHIDTNSVDYSWHPNPLDPSYIYHFPSQHQSSSGVMYVMPGSTEVKLVDAFVVTSLPQIDGVWEVPSHIDTNSIDYSWHPNPLDPPYIYHVPSQHQSSSGVMYVMPGATEIKLVDAFVVTALLRLDDENWTVPDSIDANSVDYSWHPNPLDPPYIYHFPSQHQSSSGVTYTPPGAIEIKLVEAFVVTALPNTDNKYWNIPDNIDTNSVDYSWHPNPLDPPYRYHFPSQHQSSSGVIYVMPGATEIKLVDAFVATALSNMDNWEILEFVSDIDYSWHPNPLDPPYVYHFPSQHQGISNVTYRVPSATEIKLVDAFVVTALSRPDKKNWNIPDNIDANSVDYSWYPNPLDPPYVYHFPSQHQSSSGVTYTVPGAIEIKLIDSCTVTALPRSDRGWEIPDNIDANSVDYSWHPNPLDPPYIYHFPSQHQSSSGVTYIVPGAIEIKLIDSCTVTALPNNKNWEVLELISGIDYSWHPNPLDPPYIYVFGNQWNRPEFKSSVRYVVPTATEIKYINEIIATRLPHPELFNNHLAVESFDYSWEPNPFDPPFIYVFGNQWNSCVLEPTVSYTVEGAIEIKYVDNIIATLAQDETNWEILDDIVGFDYSWRPNPTDPPYIYIVGNQWLTPEQRPALRYVVPGAIEIKYMDSLKAKRKPHPELFTTHYAADFDYTWEPDPGAPPYIYVFGNQHWPAEIMPTVEYIVGSATKRKYVDSIIATLPATHDLWKTATTHKFDFDYSWCPDPGDEPYIYVFGNQWHPAEIMPTVEYHAAGATERKFMDTPRAQLIAHTEYWVVDDQLDIDNVDYSWTPDPGSPSYIYHFGSEYQQSVGLTYVMPGATEIKFAGEIPRINKSQPVVATSDIFYLDRSNAMGASRFAALKEKYPHIQKIRYVNSVMDSIKRCLLRTKQNRFWVVGSENVYDEFDFAWHPETWQRSMTHVFGSQWNKWSDTFLINRWEFERNSRWAKGIEQFPNLNFVSKQKVVAPADASDIYIIDFGNAEVESTVEYLSKKYRVVKTSRYFDNYLDTLRRILATVTNDQEHIWIVGSVCDYTHFDFSWQPEAWQRDMLHVFPSQEQKFGDTFYVPVIALKEKIKGLELLDWFETVNYCNDQRVERWPMPVIQHGSDSHVDTVLQSSFSAPLAVFTNRTINVRKIPIVSLWREKTKTIVPLDAGSGAMIVPKNAISKIQTQMYDYPYIDRTKRNTFIDHPLDIVFISNGESNAEQNWEHLQKVTNGIPNRIVRVDGVNGRVAAYQAALNASNTPWAFCVFAKLEVDAGFDWTWLPDRMQQAKHYIFHAINPVNGLEYGHQAVIAYNKQLVIENTAPGLDFTLDQAHEVVPIMSGTANYHTDMWTCWRTSFRECIKLKNSLPNVENEYRLNQWLTQDNTEGQWSIKGANDAVKYYDTVNGEFAELKKSYEWKWLASYAFQHRNLVADQ